jgi:hypothetical protein
MFLLYCKLYYTNKTVLHTKIFTNNRLALKLARKNTLAYFIYLPVKKETFNCVIKLMLLILNVPVTTVLDAATVILGPML